MASTQRSEFGAAAWHMVYGATPLPAGTRFLVWAPQRSELSVKVAGDRGGVFPMTRAGEDFEVVIPQAGPGDLYSLVLDTGRERPDPASRSQPQGVHGPSRIVDPEEFTWTDAHWRGIGLDEFIFYELHVGTFTESGTFESIIPKLGYLKDLGITALELMPVGEFSGGRNWGYDGVDLYAPHSAYGGPEGLKRLVNACHAIGLAVVLDVVYNHLGPEGNYLGEFGPYFTDRYKTPWGHAINYDGAGSDGVRRFFVENALYWLTEFHIDALRLDAIHGIFDFSALPILAELRDRFHEQAERLGRQAWIIAESDLNDVRVIQPRTQGGLALDAQWHDEFHHSLLSVLTGSKQGFLQDLGRLRDIRKAIVEGFVQDGTAYSAYRQRRFGSSSKNEPGVRMVAFVQNHDQVANTSRGFRMTELVSGKQHKLAAALLLCSPSLPLLFMGQEFAETTPFLYFTSHRDAALARMVTEGRRKEFADFGQCDSPDPQAVATFVKSKINWALSSSAAHADMLRWYRKLISLRKEWPCLGNCRKDLTSVEIDEQDQWLKMSRSDPGGTRALLLCNFSRLPRHIPMNESCEWQLALATGPDPAKSEGTVVQMPGYGVALYLAD